MAIPDRRITRLEHQHGSSGAGYRHRVATCPLTESLEAAIEVAESETGLPILEIEPFALSTETGSALANAILDMKWEITR